MRILHLINGLGTGGAEMLVVDLAHAMLQHGHQVRIGVLSEVPGVPADKAQRLGIDLTVLGRHRFDPRLPLRIARIASGADVVHAHLFPAFYWAAIAPTRTPILFTEHNTWNRRQEKPLLRAIDQKIYRRLDQVVAISQGTAENLASALGTDPASYPIVLNGISDGLVEGPAAERPRQQKVIIVASLENRRKDINRAVRAIAELPEASLTIVGEGPDRAEIETLIEQLGLTQRVHLLGRRGDVADLLRHHDVFLSTSRVEGFGLAAGEGMAVGLPVVAPAIPGISEVVTDDLSGILYDPDDESEPAASLGRLFADAPLADRLARDARKEAARFTVDSCASNYEQHYARLIGEKAGPRDDG